MKVNLVSDLHLEFGYQELPGGEVLILSGDIAEARTILKAKQGYEADKAKVMDNHFYRGWEFFVDECSKYKRVFYVMGNHEHYHGRFDKTYHELKSVLPDNVIVLEKEHLEYNGVVFMGATLWTDLNRGDPVTTYTVKNGMNDYRVITNYYVDKGLYHKLTPEHTFHEHKKTLAYFKKTLDENVDKPFVILTHHAPSFQSVADEFKYDKHMNGGYASELSEFILDHPQIKIWTFGHMHHRHRYYMGDTLLVANPKGYCGHESSAADFVVKTIDLDNMPAKNTVENDYNWRLF